MISMYYYNNMIIIHQYSEAHDYYESVHLQEIMCQYLEVRAYYENINMIIIRQNSYSYCEVHEYSVSVQYYDYYTTLQWSTCLLCVSRVTPLSCTTTVNHITIMCQ